MAGDEGQDTREQMATRPAPYTIHASAQSWRERLALRSFELRLGASLLLVLLVVSGARYVITSNNLEQQLVRDALEVAEGQAQALKRSYLAHDDAHESKMMATAVVDGIVSSPNVVEATLLDAAGRVVTAAEEPTAAPDAAGDASHDMHADEADRSRPSGAEHAEHEEHRLAVVRSGEPAIAQGVGDSDFSFWVPVDLPSGRHVLHIASDRSNIDAQLGGLKAQLALTSIVGLVLAVGLFHLIGGRSLILRHRAALETSLRDSLTGLGNHRAFQEELRRSLARAQRAQRPAAYAIVDVDHFKTVNDRSGHAGGDEVLRLIAEELTSLRAGDMAFRVGGDEFTLIFEHTTAAEAQAVLTRIQSRISDVTISAGIAEADGADVEEPEEILERADTALYEAKRLGRDTIVIFEPDMTGVGLVTADERRALSELLAAGEMDVAFQPIWDLTRATPLGYEALARPPQGSPFAAPGPIFAVAKATDQVADLDALCRRHALRRYAEMLREQESTEIRGLFLNVSPSALVHESMGRTRLVEEVTAAGLSPGSVIIEVTERDAVDLGRLVEVLNELRRQGFRLALDDVGAGNAGLELLRRSPVDYVKIDRQVIVEGAADGPARGVLLAILTFAREAEAYVIAEGIENRDLLTFVSHINVGRPEPVGVHGVQGFFVGEPNERASADVLAEARDEISSVVRPPTVSHA